MRFFSFAFIIYLLLSSNLLAKSDVFILATGGTISGAGDSKTGAKYSAAKVDITQILTSVPHIKNLANISAQQIFNKASQDLENKDLIILAKRVDELIRQRNIDGIVITHGTDTIAQTAYFLNLVVRSRKPIILVGSMRPSTSISADGPLNLYNGVALASSKKARNHGTMVLLNDNIYLARDVRKSHTTNAASFIDDNFGAIGQVYFGDVEIYRKSLKRHSFNSSFDIRKINDLAKVDIIFGHGNFDYNVIDYYIKSGSKAIILAGVGDGNINKKTLDKLKQAREEGIFIIRSNRGFRGKVIKNVEINDDEYGFVVANNLSPQKARILAMVALTKIDNHKDLQKIFDQY